MIAGSLLHIASEDSIAWIYHTWFIHFLVDGNLGCFQFEAIMKKKLLSTFAHISFYGYMFPFLLGKHLGTELLGHKIDIQVYLIS